MLTSRSDYYFELEMEVRDYECDLQGIVNNAVYMHYLEHARHKFLHAIGLDFEQLHREGIDAVVVKAELDYKKPLRSRDRFIIRLLVHREGYLRFVFHQDIYRLPDEEFILAGKITAVLLRNGKPALPDSIMQAIERFLEEKTPGGRA
ncbi:MAG TPA: thioesterase family protein [Bacteroidales bacterium]|nr:acyl-CoA thioesterase [Bacteroidales bacterium]HQH41808.1 thioesterase family protein [Bacteroidales bacterium]